MATEGSPCPASFDDVFGPQVNTCRRAFDFTQLFEESFLSIIPSVLFILVATLRLLSLHHARRKAPLGGAFQITKLVSVFHGFLFYSIEFDTNSSVLGRLRLYALSQYN